MSHPIPLSGAFRGVGQFFCTPSCRRQEHAVLGRHALAHTNLGICQMMRGNHGDALASFERAVVLLPKNQVARDNYAAGRVAVARSTEPTS